jgi:hypothetical protein
MKTQSVEVGPVKVDTGNDYLDIGGALFIVVVGAVVAAIIRKRIG